MFLFNDPQSTKNFATAKSICTIINLASVPKELHFNCLRNMAVVKQFTEILEKVINKQKKI